MHQLYYAALLHDIGKVAVPDTILNKPGGLSTDEQEEMKEHVEMGARLLGQIERLRGAAHIVRQHHEAWDGSGYPRGLQGEEIDLEARILTVVDAYDAMTTDRPYRKALSPEGAAAELRAQAGKQFDPQAVTAFLGSPP